MSAALDARAVVQLKREIAALRQADARALRRLGRLDPSSSLTARVHVERDRIAAEIERLQARLLAAAW